MRVCEFARRTGSATVLNAPGVGRVGGVGPVASGRSAAGSASPCQGEGRGFESRRPLGGAGSRLACRRSARLFGTGPAPRGSACGGMAEWLRQGPAKPCTRVRFPLPPRGRLAQRESASLTRKRSLVQSQYRPPVQPRIFEYLIDDPGNDSGDYGPPAQAQRCLRMLRVVVGRPIPTACRVRWAQVGPRPSRTST
jgi:hypothetical protein